MSYRCFASCSFGLYPQTSMALGPYIGSLDSPTFLNVPSPITPSFFSIPSYLSRYPSFTLILDLFFIRKICDNSVNRNAA